MMFHGIASRLLGGEVSPLHEFFCCVEEYPSGSRSYYCERCCKYLNGRTFACEYSACWWDYAGSGTC